MLGGLFACSRRLWISGGCALDAEAVIYLLITAAPTGGAVDLTATLSQSTTMRAPQIGQALQQRHGVVIPPLHLQQIRRLSEDRTPPACQSPYGQTCTSRDGRLVIPARLDGRHTHCTLWLLATDPFEVDLTCATPPTSADPSQRTR